MSKAENGGRSEADKVSDAKVQRSERVEWIWGKETSLLTSDPWWAVDLSSKYLLRSCLLSGMDFSTGVINRHVVYGLVRCDRQKISKYKVKIISENDKDCEGKREWFMCINVHLCAFMPHLIGWTKLFQRQAFELRLNKKKCSGTWRDVGFCQAKRAVSAKALRWEWTWSVGRVLASCGYKEVKEKKDDPRGHQEDGHWLDVKDFVGRSEEFLDFILSAVELIEGFLSRVIKSIFF